MRQETSFRTFPIETIADRYTAPYFSCLRHNWLQKDKGVERQLKEVIDSFLPDIVHFHNFNVLTFSALDAAVKRCIPTVLSIYDYWIFCPTDMLLNANVEICCYGHGFHCLNKCLRRYFTKSAHYWCDEGRNDQEVDQKDVGPRSGITLNDVHEDKGMEDGKR